VELDDTIARVNQQLGESSAGIFRAHRMLLDDPAIVRKVHDAILFRNLDARSALHRMVSEYSALFASIKDEYLRERLEDLRDVAKRIESHLYFEDDRRKLAVLEPVIVVAKQILPSQVVTFERLPVSGIVTESGGATGHAAILARSLGIPAASGFLGITEEVHTGDLLIVDGREGTVFVNPGPEVRAAYRVMHREYVELKQRLVANRNEEAATTDGTKIELFANVNAASDAAAATAAGASGVGLYRTEYLFLTHDSVPTEEEQVTAYRRVIEAAPRRRVTVRTLDIGGDKHVPYLGLPHQANPFLGWRSTRLCFAYPELFQTQLRAILRVAEFGQSAYCYR